eukprot:SAG31_NODE_2014_length_6665_cov_2.737435_1_plen_61_part_10
MKCNDEWCSGVHNVFPAFHLTVNKTAYSLSLNAYGNTVQQLSHIRGAKRKKEKQNHYRITI